MTIVGENGLPAGAPQPGAIFADKYRVERILGVGGMGYVLAAMHLQLQERVALKLLLPDRANQPDTVARFLREGRAAVKIRSEHVARVLDVGSADGTPYIVMEYLEGSDLAAVLRRLERLPVTMAVDYLLQASEAIAEAHAMQTVHRDLKPANLFVVRRPDGTDCVKVLDFGISKTVASGDEEVAMTKTTTTVGTPLYMSPEQLRSSKNVDARADIWSLGVILFELLAGRPPFRASSLAELGALVLTADAPDVRKTQPDVPAGLAEVIRTCLRRDPRQRFASLAELAAALAPFGTDASRASSERIAQVLILVPRESAGRVDESDPRVGVADSIDMGGTTTVGAWGTVSSAGQSMLPGRRSSPATRLALAALALAVVGSAGGFAVARFAKRSSPTTAHPPAVDAVDASVAPPPASVAEIPTATVMVSTPPPATSSPSPPPKSLRPAGAKPAPKAPNRAVASATSASGPSPPPPPPPASSTNSDMIKRRFDD